MKLTCLPRLLGARPSVSFPPDGEGIQLPLPVQSSEPLAPHLHSSIGKTGTSVPSIAGDFMPGQGSPEWPHVRAVWAFLPPASSRNDWLPGFGGRKRQSSLVPPPPSPAGGAPPHLPASPSRLGVGGWFPCPLAAPSQGWGGHSAVCPADVSLERASQGQSLVCVYHREAVR